MLTLITNTGGIPLRCDDYYIKELASGLDELIFTISIWDEAYQLIQEEASIRENHGDGSTTGFYLVKAIDGGAKTATVKCQLDLDAWKSVMAVGYNSGSKSCAEIVSSVLPTGWTAVNHSGISYKRTIQLEAATPFDVLEACRTTFNNITFRFNTATQTVEIVNMANGSNLGAFVTRDLNLTANNYKGKSTGFATRLYARGKDGLTFASINGGKDYVENHTYSARTISVFWEDERYTVKANLLLDAQAKLDAMAVPQRSFDLSVVDLAAADPAKYSELAFPLFSVVSLIDQTRAAGKVDHVVVERWDYPYHPEKNKVTLSTAAPRIQSQVTQIINSITNVNSDWTQQQIAYYNTLSEAILGAHGGAVRLLDTDGDGEPDTLYIADDPDPTLAVKVWRFNYEGWAASTNGYNGPFSIGASFVNGGTLNSQVLEVVNINADNITAGTINADSINVTNINGQNIKEQTVGGSQMADGAISETKLGDYAVSEIKLGNNSVSAGKVIDGAVIEDKIGASAVTNTKVGAGAISPLKTDFKPTLDQVGVNTANIAALQSALLDTLACNKLVVSTQATIQNSASLYFHGYGLSILTPGSAAHVLGTTY